MIVTAVAVMVNRVLPVVSPLMVAVVLGVVAGNVPALRREISAGCGTLALGKLLRVPRGLSILVATGFSICGAAAIAAMESVVKHRDSDVAAAIALVTLYGGVAIAAVPVASAHRSSRSSCWDSSPWSGSAV